MSKVTAGSLKKYENESSRNDKKYFPAIYNTIQMYNSEIFNSERPTTSLVQRL